MASEHLDENAFDYELLKNIIVGIGEVAEITDIPTRKIRYWEEKGIVKSVSEAGSARRYDYMNIKKMLLIKELLDEGYTLEAAAQKVEVRMIRLTEAFRKLSEHSK